MERASYASRSSGGPLRVIPLRYPPETASRGSTSSPSWWRAAVRKARDMGPLEWAEATLPCVSWMRRYRWKEDLQADLAAGITVGVMLVPQAMSYAKLAGLHPIYGLYTSFVPLFVYALFGSSRQLAVGPVALVSLLVSNVLGGIVNSSSELYTELAILLAFMVGILECLMGLLRTNMCYLMLTLTEDCNHFSVVYRLGWLIRFISHAVISGFTTASAIVIGLSQIKYFLGYSVRRSSKIIPLIESVIAGIDQFSWPPFVMGSTFLAILLTMKHIGKSSKRLRFLRASGPLTAVVFGTIFVKFFHPPAISVVRLSSFNTKGPLTIILTIKSDVNDNGIELRHVGLVQNQSTVQREKKEHQASVTTVKRRAEIDASVAKYTCRMKRIQLQLEGKQQFVEDLDDGDLSSHNGGRDRAATAAKWSRERLRLRRGNDGGRDGCATVAGDVGEIPQGLPKFSIPRGFEHLTSLMSTAVLITGVAILESVGIAKALAAKNGYELDSNKEASSFSRSAVNHESGANTGLSGIIMGVIIVSALLFMTPLFTDIPQVDYEEAVFLWGIDKKDFFLWAITFITTLTFGIEIGVLVGVGFSLAFVIHESANPHIAVLGRLPGTTVYRNTLQYPEAYTYNGIVVVRIDAPMLREYELNLPNSNRGPDVGRVYFVILEMSPVTYIDSSAVQALKDLHQEYKARQIQIAIANPNRQVHLLLSRSGIIDLIGAGWCFVRVHDAVQVCLQHVQSSSPNSMKLAPQVSENSTDSNSTPKAEQRHRQYGFVKNLWKAHDGEGEADGEVQPLLRQNLV
ncbi:hypothetical protein PR202_ga31240 [Eleusine coracana subsp. coracana]|uniref:STAS domain-containing protein n=1 Tax=Eleusine coracana subsp. coracana TaxID=191504 RepID=A0AAV5DRS3_ELECO|nr:hypothetical protein PR202_ga31240 [Eleusine coracana subsp. coracana]